MTHPPSALRRPPSTAPAITMLPSENLPDVGKVVQSHRPLLRESIERTRQSRPLLAVVEGPARRLDRRPARRADPNR